MCKCSHTLPALAVAAGQSAALGWTSSSPTALEAGAEQQPASTEHAASSSRGIQLPTAAGLIRASSSHPTRSSRLNQGYTQSA